VAARVGNPSHLLGGGVVGVTILAIAISAVTQLPFGFGLQARYLMPLSVGVLLAAGFAIDGSRQPQTKRFSRILKLLAPSLLVACVVLQAGSWYVNERRAAVGDRGPLWFFTSGQWAPPGGWLLSTAMAITGITLLAGAALAMTMPGPLVQDPPRRIAAKMSLPHRLDKLLEHASNVVG
jgi:hypothetical protein